MTSQASAPKYLALWDEHNGGAALRARTYPHLDLSEAEQAALFHHTSRVLVVAVGANTPLGARMLDRGTGPHAQIANFQARLLDDGSGWPGVEAGETFMYEATRSPNVSIFCDSHEARLSLATVYALGQLVGSVHSVDEVVHSLLTAVHVQEKFRHLLEDRFDFLYQVSYALYRYLRRAGMVNPLLRPVLEAAVRALRAVLAEDDQRRAARLFNCMSGDDTLAELAVPRERELRWFGPRNGRTKPPAAPPTTDHSTAGVAAL